MSKKVSVALEVPLSVDITEIFINKQKIKEKLTGTPSKIANISAANILRNAENGTNGVIGKCTTAT